MTNNLVTGRDKVIDNILTLYKYLNSSVSEDVEESKKILNHGMWFVVEKIEDDLFFGPSKFVGYEDNTLKMNNENSRFRSGSDTNRRLLNFYDQIDPKKTDCSCLKKKFENFLDQFELKLSDRFTGFFVPEDLSNLLNSKPSFSEEEQEQQVEILNEETLYAKSKLKNKKVEKRHSVSFFRFVRSSYISELIKREAEGKCDLCNNLGPFIVKDNIPFLECHHIDWLSKGGDDSIENTAALCPNCHRKMHHVKDKEDINKLKKIANERAENLKDKYK